MINVSAQLLEESKENQDYYVTAEVTLADGTKLPLKKEDFYLDGNGIVDSADSSNFPVGVAIEKTATLSLVNDENQFSDYSFNRAIFVIYMNLELSDGRVETFKRGSFIVCKKPAIDEEINLTLLDYMSKTDREYETNLTFPCTAAEVLRDSCQTCGIALGDAAFKNSDFRVMKKPTGTTHRAVIGMVAALAGGNARIDENDLLRIVTYQRIDKDNFSGITVFGMDEVETDVDAIMVTGVKYTADNQDYIYGTDGYVIVLKDNQLLSGNAQDGVDRIGQLLTGFEILPFSVSAVPIGYATFGDAVKFEDYKGKVFYSYATDIEFSFADSTNFACKAKSAETQEAAYPDPSRVLVEQAKAEVLEKMSAYNVKLEQMNELAANTLGFYSTSETLDDGSTITYRHDKPSLKESKVIYKTGIDGFFLSVDGGKTWKAGFDSNGDAVLNILYAIGIQAEWINTRGLTAKDNDGNVTFRVDPDTGEIIADPSHFRLGKSSLTETLTDINNSIAASKNMTMLLSDDYQGIPVDSDGNYKTFPSGITTTATVMYGSNDISKDCTYTVTTSSGVTGNWNKNTRTYTVTGLTADKGWVTIRATYLSSVSVSKKFNLSKSYAGKDGADGDPGEMYYLKSSNTVIKRGADGLLYPDCIIFSGYRSGTGGRPPYAGRFVIEETADGNTWKTVYTSSTDEAEVTHLLYSAIATLNGKLLTTKSGKFLAVPRDFVELRVSLYAAGGTTQLIDRLSVPLVVDMAALTHEDIFNLLTDDGRIKGIYKEGNQLYINATYIRSLHVTGDQVDAKKLKVVNKDGSVTLYIDEDGNVEMKVSSLSIQGKTVDDIASTVATSIAETKASNAVKGQTQEDIFNKLSKNGTIKSVTMVNGELYISFDFAQGGTLKLGGANNGNGLLSILDASGNQVGYIDNTGAHFNQGEFSGSVTAGTGAIAGWKINSNYLESDSGSIRLYSNGQIVFGGDAVLSANGRTPTVKYGLEIHTQRRYTKAEDGTKFYDGSGELSIYGLDKTSSANTLALNMTNHSVGYVASSSMRYKTIGKTVKEEELEELYRIKVIWAKYKEDYLGEQDERYGKEMPMFLAEDVDRRFPLAVDHNEKGKAENWNYRIMIPCMFAMMKNDHEKILALQSDNQELHSKLETLSTEVQELKELINKIS